MRNFGQFIFLSILAFQLSEARAWGKIGHRVVGEVAQSRLTEGAKNQVAKILDGMSLADVANFADEVKSNPSYAWASTLHYVSIPRGSTYETAPRNPKGDIYTGIEQFKEVLKNPKETLEKKKEALSFLVHLLGDLHQPLHVGLAEDRGGNDVAVTWFTQPRNLHQIWDEDLIIFEELSYTEYAQKLVRLFAEAKAKEWMKGTVREWGQESQDLRDSIYPAAGKVDLSYGYHYQHKDLVARRLFQGGVRLASLLNQLF